MSEPETVAVVRTRSAVDTRRLAEALARACRPGDVLLLVGGLGAGKTTFAQGLAAGLGVRERVTSPTFTLVRQYRTGRSEGVVQLLHADVYRLEDLAEIEDLALDELVEDGAVAAVEWGERAAPLLGADALVVELERDVTDAGMPAAVSEDEGRTIALRAVGPRWQDRAGEVADLTRDLQRT